MAEKCRFPINNFVRDFSSLVIDDLSKNGTILSALFIQMSHKFRSFSTLITPRPNQINRRSTSSFITFFTMFFFCGLFVHQIQFRFILSFICIQTKPKNQVGRVQIICKTFVIQSIKIICIG